MAEEFLSVLFVGDSHTAGYTPTRFEQGPLLAELQPVFVFSSYSVLDLIVTYEDGRKGVNPLLEHVLTRWPGLGPKGRPLVPGRSVQKHLLLSIGNSAYACDPASAFEDRGNSRLFFRGGIDFVLPERPDLAVDPRCTLTPVALIEELFRGMLGQLKLTLTLLAARYPGRLYIVGCPPPLEDNSIKERLIGSKREQGDSAEGHVVSATVALKTWILVNRLVKDICRETGCAFINCAPIACGDRGFLKPEFGFDGIHANADYNKAMTEYIAAIVSEKARQSSQ